MLLKAAEVGDFSRVFRWILGLYVAKQRLLFILFGFLYPSHAAFRSLIEGRDGPGLRSGLSFIWASTSLLLHLC